MSARLVIDQHRLGGTPYSHIVRQREQHSPPPAPADRARPAGENEDRRLAPPPRLRARASGRRAEPVPSALRPASWRERAARCGRGPGRPTVASSSSVKPLEEAVLPALHDPRMRGSAQIDPMPWIFTPPPRRQPRLTRRSSSDQTASSAAMVAICSRRGPRSSPASAPCRNSGSGSPALFMSAWNPARAREAREALDGGFTRTGT